jgi:hypothetical protein
MVRFCCCRRPRWSWTVEARAPGRFLEQRGATPKMACLSDAVRKSVEQVRGKAPAKKRA